MQIIFQVDKQLKLTNTHEELEELISQRLAPKVKKVLQDFLTDETTAHLRLENSANKKLKLNFSLWLPGKHQLFAETQANTFKAAIVSLRQEVIQQAKSYKGKLQNYSSAKNN